MKNIFVYMVFLTTTCLIAQQGPNMFEPKEAVITAFINQTFSYYEPKYFDSYKINPVNGKEKIVSPLQQDTVADMITANGRRWVVLKKGTLLRWENNVPYAMDTCGNKIFSVFYPKETIEEIKNPSSSKEFKEFERVGKNVQDKKLSETSSSTFDVSPVSDTSEKRHVETTNNCVSTSGSRQFYASSGVTFYPYYYSNSYGNRYSYRYSSSSYRSRNVYRIRR